MPRVGEPRRKHGKPSTTGGGADYGFEETGVSEEQDVIGNLRAATALDVELDGTMTGRLRVGLQVKEDAAAEVHIAFHGGPSGSGSWRSVPGCSTTEVVQDKGGYPARTGKLL